MAAASVQAQNVPLAHNEPSGLASAPVPSGQRSTRPDERHCIRDTGSLIRTKKHDCLPVAGRSYGGDELRQTGRVDTAHALEALDPRVSIGH
jgi:hypothetical protein